MELLVFSDVHRDADAARDLVARAHGVDVVVGAGDFATMRRGLTEIIELIAQMPVPVALVPGNGESDRELADACEEHAHLHALHGSGVSLSGQIFFGIGGAVPETPFGSWSFDLSEGEARELLTSCPSDCVLISHSPPLGHCDIDGGGRHLGSEAVLDAVMSETPRLVVCGHVHASWGTESTIGPSRIVNPGPEGRVVTL